MEQMTDECRKQRLITKIILANTSVLASWGNLVLSEHLHSNENCDSKVRHRIDSPPTYLETKYIFTLKIIKQHYLRYIV